MTLPIAELAAAGLYDAEAPDAAESLALIAWLVSRGATIEHMVRRTQTGSLFDVAGDLGRARGESFTLAEASVRTGVPVERIEAIRFASGLSPLEPDEPGVTEDEARSFGAFIEGERLFGTAPVRRFTQVLGAALARAAEAAVSMSVVNLTAPIRQGGGTMLEMAEARYRAAASSVTLADAVSKLFLVHIEEAVRRIVPGATGPVDSLYTSPLAVGFIDLVGFTPLARQVEPHELAAIVDRFEETAHDVANVGGGRIVKFIGDEVMFVTEREAAACDIALTLVERFADDEAVTPRGAIAAGDVLLRGGDYYGPIVNLAARMAQLAVPAEILVTEPVSTAAITAGLRCEPAGRRVLKGFDAPVRVLTVERAGG